MDIEVRKLHFIQEFLAIHNEKVIDKLEAVLKQEGREQGNERVSLEQYNQELDEANARIEGGEYVSQDEVKRESDSWLK
jgi:ElaB/YqjD/DUF883 family membrane-anchored ribosome-binding protein